MTEEIKLTLRGAPGAEANPELGIKGSALTYNEIDNNFEKLRDGITQLVLDNDTDRITEGEVNLYLNGTGTTDDLTEGEVNLYLNGTGTTDVLTEGTSNLYLNGTGTTDVLTEGEVNLYYTEARVLNFTDEHNIPNKEWVQEHYEQLLTGEGFATVAISGSYNDLEDTPTIPTNNNELVNGFEYITLSDISADGDIEYDPVTGIISFVKEDISYENILNTPTDLSSFTNNGIPEEEVFPYIKDADIRNDFEAIDTRITDLDEAIDTRITDLDEAIDTRITAQDEAIDTRITDLDEAINTRITDLNADVVLRLDALEAEPETVFDLFRLAYDSSGYTISDATIEFRIRLIDNMRLVFLGSGQSDPNWDAMVNAITQNDIAEFSNIYHSIQGFEKAPIQLSYLSLINSDVLALNEAFAPDTPYDTLTLNEFTDVSRYSDWQERNAQMFIDAETFNTSQNPTYNTRIAEILVNNSYADFTRNTVVTNENPT